MGIERVRMEGLVKTFGATAALRGVSGELRAGELTMIEGANGSGKTTLLRILGIIMKPTAGLGTMAIEYDDRQQSEFRVIELHASELPSIAIGADDLD